MAGRRGSNSLALALVLAGTAACAPSVTIAEESAEGGEAGAVASGGNGNQGGNGQGGTGGTGAPSGGISGSGADGAGGAATRIFLHDATVHRSALDFTIPIIETASGVDLDVCWTDATSDLACADVDPQSEINTAAMMRFSNVSEAEVERLLSQGELQQSQLDGYLAHESDHDSTCTKLFSLTNFGTLVDVSKEYIEDDEKVYLFTFTRDAPLGVGMVTMIFAKPSASSTNTRVDAPPGCGLRTVTTNLTTSQHVPVPLDGPWIVDWSNVTIDGQGNEFDPHDIDRVTLWYVAGSTPSDVEFQVPELDSIATERYDGEILGEQSVNLGELSSARDGGPFASFRMNQAGVWLFGLRCSLCMNADLPRVLAVLLPGEVP